MGHHSTHDEPTTYGLIAEFESPHDLLDSTKKAYAAGYRKMDAYTPVPIHGLEEALGMKFTKLPLLVFACGLIGGIGGFLLCYLSGAEWYPINIGGRPFLSWPAFIPITFECTVLFSAFGAVFGMLAFNNLPMPYHPIFNAPGFERASVDRFFLCIETEDPKFDAASTRSFLEGLGANRVSEVES